MPIKYNEGYGKDGYEDLFLDDVVNRNLDKLDLIVHEISGDEITEIDTLEELAEVDESYFVSAVNKATYLEDILKTNNEHMIQKYLERQHWCLTP